MTGGSIKKSLSLMKASIAVRMCYKEYTNALRKLYDIDPATYYTLKSELEGTAEKDVE